MRRMWLTLMLCTMIACVSAVQVAGAETLTPADVIAIDRALDGSVVTITGEAIGEDLRADSDHRWVNLLGGGAAIGVVMTDEQAALIEHYGDYTLTGDLVQVTGTLNIACDTHGGEFDIHAQEVVVLAQGFPIEHPVDPWKGTVALIAFVCAFIAMALLRYLRQRDPA